MIKVRAVQSLVFQAVISAWFVVISGGRIIGAGGAIGATASACSITAAGAATAATGYIWNLVNDLALVSIF